jgi:dienelactone hydrolase
MVWIPVEESTPLTVLGVTLPHVQRIPAIWMDRYEVTNRQFKEFVDKGGYQRPELWKERFVKDGKILQFEQAMQDFRDATGKPGPSTWDGSYPDGTADLPVGGVSWYEASAYAEFVHKELPTVYHWYIAAGIGITSQIIPWSNFGLKGPVAAGTTLGLGPYGNYDMAGNVKEWTVNSSDYKDFILGGGWNEPSYMFQQGDARSPWDREATFGFRCALYVDPLSQELSGEVEKKERNRTGEPPVDDRTFETYKRLLIHDETDLDVRTGPIIDAPHWSREDVSFQASYGNDRVIVHLFKPKDVAPPYQIVFFSAGGNMRFAKTPEEVWTRLTEWIVKSGRAVVLPAYAGTLDRRTNGPVLPVRERDLQIQSLMDISRTIDYLQTRKDFDTSKIAFAGVSFGSGLGLRAVTVEPRFKAAVLLSLGYTPEGGEREVDSWNYAPRVKVPVLMLSGEDDSMAPMETAQRPMFNALGSPIKEYKHYPGGHVDYINREEVIQKALEWLDKYLAPVNVRH